MARRLAVLLALASAGTVLACSSDDAPASSQPSYPRLADYDDACMADTDCAPVAAEGCASCGRAALATGAAAMYSAALATAEKTPECQKELATAGPCASATYEAHCSSLHCVAVRTNADAGADAASPDAGP